MVGLGLPDGAEREQLRAKWAAFSDNIASYVVCSSGLCWGDEALWSHCTSPDPA